MTINTRCQICDMAWDMEKSEQQLYREFDEYERAQLLATYRSQQHRSLVTRKFPVKRRKA